MFKYISLLGACLLSLASATTASATPITWFASAEVTSLSGIAAAPGRWPGLTVGTPWSMTVTFDPDGPRHDLSSAFPDCNYYSTGSATLNIGQYTYSSSGGSIYTEAGYPSVGCAGNGSNPVRQDGLIQFVLGGWRSDDPNAWNFGTAFGAVLAAGYYDLLANDGTLPTVPTYDPVQGTFAFAHMLAPGLGSQSFLFGLGVPQFQLVEQPAPVPEPGTLTLVGIGLAAAVRRARARRRP